MESIHPIAVHFPIALLITAFLVETLALAGKRPAWHRVALWNLTLGALAAAAAVWTGRQAMAAAKHSMEIYEIMELHEKLGYIVLSLAAFITGWRLWRRDLLSVRSRRIAWALLGVACGILVFSAYLGGRMVYEFGVGGSYGRSGGIEVVK